MAEGVGLEVLNKRDHLRELPVLVLHLSEQAAYVELAHGAVQLLQLIARLPGYGPHLIGDLLHALEQRRACVLDDLAPGLGHAHELLGGYGLAVQ